MAPGPRLPRTPGCATSGSCHADPPAFGCFLSGGNRGFCSAPPRPAPSGFGKRILQLKRRGPCGLTPILQVRSRETLRGQDPRPAPCIPYRASVSACHLPTRAPLVRRPSPHLVRCQGRGRAPAEAEGPPGPERAGSGGTTCPARTGAGGAGRAPLREPERAPAVEPGRVRARPWPSRAPAPRARGGASSWTGRWRPSGRERVRPGFCEGSAVGARGHGRGTDSLRFSEGGNGPCGAPGPRLPGGSRVTLKEVLENEDSPQRKPGGQGP